MFADRPFLNEVKARAESWALINREAVADQEARTYIQGLWNQLLDPACGDVCNWDAPNAQSWCDAVMELLAISDAASEGMGFYAPTDKYPLVDFLVNEHRLRSQKSAQTLPHIPWSLCYMVPPEEACVQPKNRTPNLGCTLRNWSHNLALLPSVGQVSTTWLIGNEPSDDALTSPELQTMNILFVPFPYVIDNNCFVANEALVDQERDAYRRSRLRSRYFRVAQNWLTTCGRELTAAELTQFLSELINVSENTHHAVNAIVMPELALTETLAIDIARRLAGQRNLELFVCGVATEVQANRLPRNSVYSCIYQNGRVLTDWMQSKHHRWMLQESQITSYHLTDRLHPHACWWEKIDIEDRKCAFYVFKHGMSVVTLICEDLARIDPVQAVIRAVGPNLVLALLMDGPQLAERWGARYATVLADDPGSAVLVLTSMGLLRRQAVPPEEPAREVMIWKGAEGKPIPVPLTPGNHSLLLTLTPVQETGFTMDGRSDEGMSLGLKLSDWHQIKHPTPPVWARND
ncbi:MAG: hypothetical protein AB7O59_23505 [Pirellulales bacterium]